MQGQDDNVEGAPPNDEPVASGSIASIKSQISHASIKPEPKGISPANSVVHQEIEGQAANIEGQAARSSVFEEELMPIPDGMVLRQYPGWVKYLVATITICSGAFSAIASKWQNEQNAPKCNNCEEVAFEGALLQTFMMFIGESLAFPAWYIDARVSARQNRAPLLEFNTDIIELQRKFARWYWWPGASCTDFTATVLIMIAQQNCSNAVVTMLRNFMVVMSGLLQMIIIRKALLIHEWVGISIITAAMIFFAVPKFTSDDDDFSTLQTTMGIILTLIGTSFQSLQLLYEEWILRKGRYPATKAVGVEGFGGLVICAIAYAPFQAWQENVTGSIYQVFHSRQLVLISLMYLPIAWTFNIFGIGTTKLGGGVLRGVCFSVRAPITWVLNIICGWDTYNTWCLLGTIVFFFGFIIYTSFIPVHIWVKPVHVCCTKPELDGVDVGHEMKKKVEHEEDIEAQLVETHNPALESSAHHTNPAATSLENQY